MSTPEPVSLSTITVEIAKVIRDLRKLGDLPDDRNEERATLITILEHVSGIVEAAAGCKDGTFVPRWSTE